MFYGKPSSTVIVFSVELHSYHWFEEAGFRFCFLLLHSSVSDALVTEVSPIQVKVYISFSVSRSARDVGIVTSHFNHGRARLGFYEGFFLSQNFRQRAPYCFPGPQSRALPLPLSLRGCLFQGPGLEQGFSSSSSSLRDPRPYLLSSSGYLDPSP